MGGSDPNKAAPARLGRVRPDKGAPTGQSVPPLLGGVGKRVQLAVDGQPLERRGLDLADTLARDPEVAAYRVERFRIAIAVQPVAELDDLLLARR